VLPKSGFNLPAEFGFDQNGERPEAMGVELGQL